VESLSRIRDVRTRKIPSQARAKWLAHSTRCSKQYPGEPGICTPYVGICLFRAYGWDALKINQDPELATILGNSLAVNITKREDNSIRSVRETTRSDS
jgi:hypothetical protein